MNKVMYYDDPHGPGCMCGHGEWVEYEEDVMTHDEVVKLIVEDIQNMADGAGSDLRDVGDLEDATWLYVNGYLDVHALANTVLYAFKRDKA